MKTYGDYSDEELIRMLRNGNVEITDFIMEKYKNLVRKKARAMYLIGGDNDDLIQEGMIGLFKAIRDYREEREASFFHFADLCIGRQIYSAVEMSRRKKHLPLNTYVSLYEDASEGGEDGLTLVEALQSISDKNPEELLIDQESAVSLEKRIDQSLSDFEKEVLDRYLAGNNYAEIAAALEKTPKSVDNALQRVKNKLLDVLED
ncbi:RNA polymerase sporulation sigma factor SigH [Diplocloster agilis]|uniref:RNA polymerase sigma factor SigS n=1 Tax=Diplocloster agilis TaxID=2850323 RepID=A0A949NH45_9FIRM|nr:MULTISPECIES: RNA polymerase sporulation sigma factor SigH [Lachnospiraceae]MBU9737628.1 RNA polymerase sporulation sigma factor SigH [Diplocloster agilis]MBU9747082.1 RNA polymerase sporulation sigma factor SigH [Diplocloster agilis]MCU6734057.1 RNA polymerase sporulation sigma factor SigH [Suonthocola fibrivorans]SCJ22417.1 Stage 0 sporulation protein H [uncultured Clostridium sp.]